jgi:hypothetical protein
MWPLPLSSACWRRIWLVISHLNAATKIVGLLRLHDQVKMGRHQAIGQDPQWVALVRLPQQVDESLVVWMLTIKLTTVLVSSKNCKIIR